jgi:hypothetical protein
MNESPNAFPFVGEQIERERLLPDGEMLGALGLLDGSPHDLLPGGIAQSMHHPAMTVPAFQRESQLACFIFIEDRTPAN